MSATCIASSQLKFWLSCMSEVQQLLQVRDTSQDMAARKGSIDPDLSLDLLICVPTTRQPLVSCQLLEGKKHPRSYAAKQKRNLTVFCCLSRFATRLLLNISMFLSSNTETNKTIVYKSSIRCAVSKNMMLVVCILLKNISTTCGIQEN